MTTRTHKQCGFCTHFHTKDAPDQAAHGIGACHGFDGNTGPVEPFVRATAHPCVQYHRAADLAPRERFVAKHQQREAA